jgi:hypothetical protein
LGTGVVEHPLNKLEKPMRRFISTALLALIAVSCGPGDSAAPAAPDEPTPTATVSTDAEESDVPETEPTGVDESEPQPAYDTKADLATAQSLVDAWLAADLPLGEVRDNTEKQCPDPAVWKCTALITTDYVSVRVFVGEAEAAGWGGPGRETYLIGRVNISYGGDSDFWPFDTAPYNAVVAEVLGSGPVAR